MPPTHISDAGMGNSILKVLTMRLDTDEPTAVDLEEKSQENGSESNLDVVEHELRDSEPASDLIKTSIITHDRKSVDHT